MSPSVEHGCWQCSGCRVVFIGPWKKECPNCQRTDYWTGSVEPKARAEAMRNIVLDRDAAQALADGYGRELKLAAAELAWWRGREAAVRHLLDKCDLADGGPDFVAAVRALRDYPEFKP